jgi:hypothetical protein
MDIFDNHFVDLLRALTKNKVEYIMVGGFAVNLHGFSRTTADLDIFLNDNLENRIKFRLAIKDALMGDYETLETMQFVPGWTTLQMNNGMELDILCSLKGIEESFETCLIQASYASIYEMNIPFLHINHLINNKKFVNRPKDQIDVIELEKIILLRNSNQ